MGPVPLVVVMLLLDKIKEDENNITSGDLGEPYSARQPRGNEEMENSRGLAVIWKGWLITPRSG